MTIWELLDELEQPPCDCDILDIDKLLRECGYTRDLEDGVLIYTHAGWGSDYTFPASKSSVPVSRLVGIFANVRRHLEQEGKV